MVALGEDAFEVAEQGEGGEDDGGGQEGQDVHAQADPQAEGGGAPEAGGGGEAVDLLGTVEDGSGAEEADAHHDAVGDAGGVDADLGAGGVVPGECGDAGGDEHDQCGGEADEHVGSEAGVAAADFAFDADQAAGGGGKDDAEDGLGGVAKGGGPGVEGGFEVVDEVGHAGAGGFSICGWGFAIGHGDLGLTFGMRCWIGVVKMAIVYRLLYRLGVLGLVVLAGAGERGVWVLPRKDRGNTGRADVSGEMTAAPKEAWRFGGVAGGYSFLAPIGDDDYLAQAQSGLRVVRADGSVAWDRGTLGVTAVMEVGPAGALVALGTDQVALVAVGDGSVLWRWSAPPGAMVGSWKIWHDGGGGSRRLICFPQNSLRGVCIEPASGRVLWDRQYDGYWKGFGPQIVLADMDGDGVDDVVVAGKPGYAGVVDARSGAVKFEVKYQVSGGHDEGRPYGLLTATDLDGDGFPDVVMISCQVEEYLAVLHNESGKGLRHVWSRFLEHDLPEDRLELRPNVTSVADVDGDGRKEIVVGLFNVTGDRRWHTVVIDPMKGFDSRKADLIDRYFWGCYDLSGDGRAEIVTSTEHARKVGEAARLEAIDGRTFQEVAGVEAAKLATVGGGPMPANAGFMALRATPRFCRSDGAAGLLLETRGGKGVSELWSVRGDGESNFRPLTISPGSNAVAQSLGGEDLGRLDRRIDGPSGGVAAGAPLVDVASGRRELVLALSDGTIVGGQPDWSSPGKFNRYWAIKGEIPALWVSDGGDRMVCAVRGQNLVMARPERPGDRETMVALPYPVYRHSLTRSGATVLPFGGERARVYVGLQTGVHTMASALCDEGGEVLWVDAREGPYPRTAAVGELNGATTIVVDNHGKHLFYDTAGKSRLIAHGWNNTVPGRGDGAKYVVPILGPFGAGGATRVLMSSGLECVETLDASGRRLAKRNFESTYEYEWNTAAVGRVRGGNDGAWDLGMVNKQGVLCSMDAETCRVRWRVDLGCRATTPINLIAADVNGDGRDEWLAGLPDGRVVAVREREGRGEVLWEFRCDRPVRDLIFADVDGDGKGELVVETEEGCVRIAR